MGMLHLAPLAGEPEYVSVDAIVQQALADICALETGGIDGIIVENWHEKSRTPCVSQKTAACFRQILQYIAPKIHLPWGINVLNNDYMLAFSLAKQFHAHFVQLDVFVDTVKSAFAYNAYAKQHPFVIQPHPAQIAHSAHTSGNMPFIVFIQPKHYEMLQKEKTLFASALEAKQYGASAVIITKATGIAPEMNKIRMLKSSLGIFPVGIGSGVTKQTVSQFLSIGDFCIIGTALKQDGILDNPVDSVCVEKIMKRASIVKRKNLL